jgi:hypothetical protein
MGRNAERRANQGQDRHAKFASVAQGEFSLKRRDGSAAGGRLATHWLQADADDAPQIGGCELIGGSLASASRRTGAAWALLVAIRAVWSQLMPMAAALGRPWWL